VRRHFENPEEAWTEAFRTNDGGISYLVRRLTPICDPATKAAQVRHRLAELRSDIVRELERFHVAGDVQIRIAQRRQVGDRIMERLYDTNDPVQLGSLLKSMQVDGGDLAAYLYGVLVQGVAAEGADPAGEAAAQAAAISSQRARVGRARPGAPSADGSPSVIVTADRPAGAGRTTWERRAAREIMRCWERSMAASVDSPQLLRLLGIGRDLLAEISAELLTLARRAGLEGGMEKAIARVSYTEQNEQRIAKAAMIGERFVNRLVSEMGFGEAPLADRPTVTVDGVSRAVFAPRPATYGIDGWNAAPPTFLEDFFDDWANGFYRVIEDNAKSLAGLTVDIEQNDRLGRILTDLRVPV
jgi:hypothetical protein